MEAWRFELGLTAPSDPGCDRPPRHRLVKPQHFFKGLQHLDMCLLGEGLAESGTFCLRSRADLPMAETLSYPASIPAGQSTAGGSPLHFMMFPVHTVLQCNTITRPRPSSASGPCRGLAPNS